MTKGEKREQSDILMRPSSPLKDLDECKKFFPTCAPWRS